MREFKEQIFKVLSRNDTGETGGHQSGISIPRAIASSSIFPEMSKNILNQRREINLLMKVEKNGVYNTYTITTSTMANQ